MIRFLRNRADDATRVIRRAILTLAWERGWRVAWRIVCMLGGMAVLALLGVFDAMAPWLHGLILAAAVVAAAIMVWRSRLRWPGGHEAQRRVEEVSSLSHRPLRSAGDQRAAGDVSLWRAHQAWMAARLKEADGKKSALRVGLPMPQVAMLDPLAVRAAVFLMLVAAVAAAGDEGPGRLWRALVPQSAPAAPVLLDAWITPPDYTARPPIYLSRATGAGEDSAEAAPVTVPAGSRLGIHMVGARRKPELRFTGAMAGDAAGFLETYDSGDSGVFDARGTLTASGGVAVFTGSRQQAAWQIQLRADAPPTIAFAGPPGVTDSATMRLDYEISDDYGVETAQARIVLQKGGASGGDDAAIIVPLRLPSPGAPASAPGMSWHDLTAHHWAGLPVEITLQAVDGAGQQGESAPLAMSLPAREFSDPLARAVIEQRRGLASGDVLARQAAQVLNGLGSNPARDFSDAAAWLGLRAAYWRLWRWRGEAAPEGIYPLMWDVALQLEDGDLSLAERALREAQEALMTALESGAPDSQIEELLADLRRALERFLQALAREGRDNVQQAGLMPSGEQSISPQDLERMLNGVADLTRTGARDRARELLSQMRGILENLRPAGMSAEAAAQQAQAMQALEGLGDLIDDQQRLMDQTAQWNREAGFSDDNDNGTGTDGEAEGEAGSNPGAETGAGMGERQESLRQTLRSLMEGIGGSGIAVPDRLTEAGEAMAAAAGHLQEGTPGPALPEQGRALEALREGARQAARQFMESMQSASGGGRASGRHDPLGRPMRESGSSGGEGVVRTLEGSDIQRAFEIQRELRRRAGERLRPSGELDYLNRLLRRFSPRDGAAAPGR